MEKCRWCDQTHAGKCPLISSVEFYEDGVTVRRIEFMRPCDYQPPQYVPSVWPLPPLPTTITTLTWPPNTGGWSRYL